MTGLRLHVSALGEAWRRVASQPWASLVAALVIAIAVAMPVVAYVVVTNAMRLAGALDTHSHINVFLSLNAGDADVKRVEAALRSHPAASAVRFVPRSAALEEMKASSHLAELLAQLDRNPLPHAFSVRMRSRDAKALTAARADWIKLPGVDQVSADFAWAEKLSQATRFAQRAVSAFGLVLAVAVLLIVGHLIRLQVVSRRDEMALSQLIGATAADVRRAFLYHGVLQGMGGAGLALLMSMAGANWLQDELQALTSSYVNDLKVIFLDPGECLAVLGGTVSLALGGAWLAVSLELRRFSWNS